ncbi:hypothetical protein SGLAD_v1c02860 [Spiroplasma gladiatoris]|uniref:Transmembrane protein n=1 Tax=Spiroplasma gladiatoris TaxID=2143 RepID=A0A4P7AGH7_9MOLU|nr:hypothetical protein [Spiroplasma gladiatoris]QBQ07485.1 hypothetical protein SGLAD_v1c02860 [Spiroplasma gladiatoris]
MGYKLGALVSYNDENWVIIDIKTKEISEGQLTFLKIKNVLSQEIINVNSNIVREVEIKPIKDDKKETLEDTQYIQSLFKSVGDDDSDEFFDFGEEDSLFDIEEIEIDNSLKSIEEYDSIKENNQENNFVREQEIFQPPETNVHITNKSLNENTMAFVNSNPVDDTLSNMQPIGILKKERRNDNNDLNNLYEGPKIMPSRVRNNNNNVNVLNDYKNTSQIENQNINENILKSEEIQFNNNFTQNDSIKINNALQNNQTQTKINNVNLNYINQQINDEIIKPNITEVNEKLSLLNNNGLQNSTDNVFTKKENTYDSPVFYKKSFESLRDGNKSTLNSLYSTTSKNNLENKKIEPINFKKTMADPNIYDYSKNVQKPEVPFEESLETAELDTKTDKLILEGLVGKAKKHKEKHFDALTTGPLNTKKLLESFNKQQKISENIKNNFKTNQEKNENTIFGLNSKQNKNLLKESKTYKKFKLMTGFLIAIFTISFILPIIGIFMKSSFAYLELKEFNFNSILEKVLHLYILDQNSFIEQKVYFVADLFLIILTPIWFLTLMIYALVYLISISDKQYKKIAYYNFELQNKMEIIEQIQEYNNESSTYIIKIHNDIKRLKKDLNYSKSSSNKEEKEQTINIPH